MRTRSIITSALVVLPLFVACRESDTAPRGQRQQSAVTADVAADPGGGGTVVFHVVNGSDFANLTASSGGSDAATTRVMVSVSRTGTPSDPHTMLFYSINRCDGTSHCAFVEVGSGEIPNADFKGSGAGAMTLETNTSALSNPSFPRFVGSGGPIALEWRSDGFSSTLTNGTFEHDFGTSSRSEHGESLNHSASVTGTLIGLALPLPDGTHDGSIGTGQQEITIRNR